MQWALLSRQWKDEARWMTKGENGDLGWAPAWKTRGGRGGQEEEEEGQQLLLGTWGKENVCAYTENLSLMISLLACTQTYKNNTALIWHHVIITVWQTFRKNKNKRIQTNKNLMERHSRKKSPVPSCLKWSKSRNTTWSKEVSTESKTKQNHLTHVHQSGAGSLRHKCYDPGEPNDHATVQFSFSFSFNHVTMILPSNVLFPFQIDRKTALQKRKCPEISSSSSSASIYIYPYVYIHTPNHRDTRIFV